MYIYILLSYSSLYFHIDLIFICIHIYIKLQVYVLIYVLYCTVFRTLCFCSAFRTAFRKAFRSVLCATTKGSAFAFALKNGETCCVPSVRSSKRMLLYGWLAFARQKYWYSMAGRQPLDKNSGSL